MSRPDRWQKAAERANARAERDAGPLFAALVPKTTPEGEIVRRDGKLLAAQPADESP